jgi:hypothetical protein
MLFQGIGIATLTDILPEVTSPIYNRLKVVIHIVRY